jgi:hypothetical protein
MSQDHWLPGFNFNVEEWDAEGLHYGNRRDSKEYELDRPHMVRSMRRTLAKMVAGNVLCAEGRGRPSSPYRYSVHPFLMALMKIAAKDKADDERRKEAKGPRRVAIKAACSNIGYRGIARPASRRPPRGLRRQEPGLSPHQALPYC